MLSSWEHGIAQNNVVMLQMYPGYQNLSKRKLRESLVPRVAPNADTTILSKGGEDGLHLLRKITFVNRGEITFVNRGEITLATVYKAIVVKHKI